MKNCEWRLLLVLVLILVQSVRLKTLHAQERASINTENTGLWNGYYIKAQFTNKLKYHAEHHFRFRNDVNNTYSYARNFSSIYNRIGLNILFNDSFEAIIGPALIFNFTPEPNNPNFEKLTLEPRIWHQWLFKMKGFKSFDVYHQFRFEHRWKRSNQVDTDYDFTNRYRYRLFSYIPLNASKIQKNTVYFYPSAEIFLQSGKSVVYNPLEDFRIHNGFGYVMDRNVTLFVGHMWTIGQKATGFEYRMSHIFRFNILFGLDLRKFESKIPPVNLGY